MGTPAEFLEGRREDDLDDTGQYGSLGSEAILRTFSSMEHRQ